MKLVNFRFLFIILLFSNLLFAKSLEWQKIELEQMVKQQYEDILLPILKKNEFYLHVNVKYNDPGMPSFDDLNKDDLKVSDISFDSSKGDYIAFSKVGLEVPVLGKIHKENQKRLKEMYRFNESFDLFKNFQSIDITLNISDLVSESKYNMAKDIANSYSFSIANFTPKISVKKVKLSEIEAAKPQQNQFDFFEFLGKFGNAIGMILTVIIFGIVAFKLLKMWMDFMERLKAMENPESDKSAEDDKDDSKEKEESQLAQDSTAEEDDESHQIASFERFEKLLELNSKQATLLIKKWIKNRNTDSELALSGIAQQLDSSKLELIFKELNSQERELWNNQIIGYLEGEKLTNANILISQGVIKELVGGSVVDDFELVDLLLSMNVDMVKNYILQNKEFGSILCNLINPDLISELLNGLSTEELNEVISNSLSFDLKTMESQFDAFKKDLSAFCQRSMMKPFNYKLLQVVSEVSSEKENLIYRFMSKGASKSDILNVAVKNLPSELVFDLPSNILKVFMQNYPMEKKINLLSCLEDGQQEFLLNSFTAEGSNAREMIEMELNAIKDNDLLYKRIKMNKNTYWGDFVGFVRAAVNNDDEIKVEVSQVVENWVDSLKSENAKVA